MGRVWGGYVLEVSLVGVHICSPNKKKRKKRGGGGGGENY